MPDFLEPIVTAFLVGLVRGTLYGVIGLGIVLIYKSQRVINFAQAEIATFAAFMLFFALTGPWKLGQKTGGYAIAVIFAIAMAIVLSLLIERLVYQPLRDSPDVTVFVATAGVALLLIALTLLIGGANINIVPAVAPTLEQRFADIHPLIGLLSPQRLLVLLVLIAGSLMLTVFFKTAWGKAILAMSSEPFAVRLAGINPNRLSLLIWGLTGLLAGAAGVAFIPTSTLVPGAFTSEAIIPALTAVVIGGLTSLPGALAGGIIVGFISELAAAYAPAGLPGPNIIAAFVILLLTLLFRPQGLLARGT